MNVYREMKPEYIELSNCRLAYYRKGKGEPLLLVHGIPTYSFIWEPLIALFQNHFDVIAIDLPGCGNSGKSTHFEYSIKNNCRLIADFLTALEIDKIHYVGHDIGGGIGQRFAVEYTERLYNLILLNPVAYDFWPVQPIIAMRTPILRQLAMASLDFGTLKLIVKRAFHYKNKVTPELMELFWKPLRTKEGRKGFLHFAKSLNNDDLMEISEELKNLKLNVLIVRGDADVYLSSEITNKLHREIQGSKMVIIPTSGHFIQMDEPELVANTVLHFIKEEVHAQE